MILQLRQEFSIALAELADTMEALSTADISKQLSSTFTKLAALQRKARELQDEQAQQDVVTFAGTGECTRFICKLLLIDLAQFV